MIKKLMLCIVLFTFMNMNVTPVRALTLENLHNPTSFTVNILPWEQVDRIIPRKSIFTIIDVETGEQFNVQRRAGQRHADVQPLTHKDTKIMKKIYSGKWSWKRKAILIMTKDQLVAASMHGMPHGAGALKNGFPGHFCVHFDGSTTHGSRHQDLTHKLMILRAGGELENYLNEIDPRQVVKVFESAVNQGDQRILNRIIKNGDKQVRLHEKLNDILIIKFAENSSLKNDTQQNLFFQHIKMTAVVYKRDNSSESKNIDFILWKDLTSGQWIIDDQLAEEF
ncbi:hypothetical protein JMM81_07980 [Bacillus sp. V3B]|uniref:hypothetical protein n=1 Tax=Bacillus sp. V3B TaxID=2804915 RepID=UPI00210AFAAA|nr:hypothetical protein [Bacillus sp. V3B]MCQ6274902.1 hypothetical protein [Bacillus sp. V3B]